MPTDDLNRTAHQPNTEPVTGDFTPFVADGLARPDGSVEPVSPPHVAGPSHPPVAQGPSRPIDHTPGDASTADPNGDTIGLPANSGRLTMNHDGADALTASPGTDAGPLSRTGLTGSAEVTSGSPGPVPEIPGYVVEAEIARGGMGVVFKARHLRFNRPAAIKMILGGKYHDPATRIRFLIEAEVVAQLDHPHVVGVYEFGTHENLPFFALEYIGGGTLAGKLAREGPLAPRAAGELVAKLADAIAAAHAKGIVHRDLKPANILLTEAGEPKIADFGLAKVGQSDMTATGSVMGTPSYMSPEQAAGRVREVGTATDVYALGAILYELLSGRPPFLGNTAMGTIQLVLTRDPDRPRAIDTTIPRDLETICLKCLEKDAKKRYGTAAGLAEDLRAFLDGRPITARPVGNIERAWKWTKRHPERAAGAVAGVVLAVGLVVAWGQIQAQRADDRIAADAKRAADLKETRASSLVQALVSADTAGVPRLIADLAEYRDLTGPQLRELSKHPVTTKPGLHARMALLSEQPEQAEELAKYLPECKPEELLPIRSLLKPHAATIAPGLWSILTGPNAGPGKRVRAAGVLAGLTPDDPRWPTVAPGVVEAAVGANPGEFVAWSAALEPIRGPLLPALIRRYPESRGRIRSRMLSESDLVAEAAGFDLTANLLAQYTADRPSELAELATIVDARHHRLFASAIETNRAAVVPVLRAELDKVAFPGGVVGSGLASLVGAPVAVSALNPDPVFDDLAKRKANAVAVLLKLGESEPVWPVFQFPADGDPSTRSYLIERLAAIGADPLTMIRRFREETELSAKRALLIALGDFPVSPVWVDGRERLARELLTLYREHPDPGLHGAIDWLLRQRWGKAEELEGIDAAMKAQARASTLARVLPGLAGAAASAIIPAHGGRGRDWYVNGEGQTYAVVHGPKEFILGSPATESGRYTDEMARRERIGRSFAIATKEVTVEQFLRFRPGHKWTTHISPDRDSPTVRVTWYDAVEYCNWLSEREGIPREQWCYEPNEKGLYAEGMQIKSDHLKLGGYRLPTEAEWEYACRSGSVVSYFYGRSEELLARYGWYHKNGEERSWPVGRLRPNDLGLFDTLGNVWEWVEDPRSDYYGDQLNDKENPLQLRLKDQTLRFLRGGSFFVFAVNVRCANRFSARPATDDNSFGFRPARTYPD